MCVLNYPGVKAKGDAILIFSGRGNGYQSDELQQLEQIPSVCSQGKGV